jgi:hypothetical protein
MKPRTKLAGVGSVVLAASLFSPVRNADGAEPNDFIVELADGTNVTGPLIELAGQWSVRLAGAARPTDDNQIVTMYRAGTLRPAFPTAEQVIFANADRIPAQVQKLVGERLLVRAALGRDQELTIPLAALTVLWITAPENVNHPDLFLRQLAAERRRQDIVYLRNGDTVEGLLTGLDRSSRLRVENHKKEVQVEFSKVAAVALNTELTRSFRPKASYSGLVLANGTRLGLLFARADRATLTGRTLFGADISVPMGQVVALNVYQAKTAYLSDLKPGRYEMTPYLGTLCWPYVRDASVVDGSDIGGDLRLGGATFEKGLGMHSASRLSYDLANGYKRFEALVGLDDCAERAGNLRVQVIVDGKAHALGWDGELTRATSPRRVRVGVTNARTLELVVEFGRQPDVQGRVDWAEARLIK